MHIKKASATSVTLIPEKFDLNPKFIKVSHNSQKLFVSVPPITSDGLGKDDSTLLGNSMLDFLLPILLEAMMTGHSATIPKSSPTTVDVDTLPKLIDNATIQQVVVNLAGEFKYFETAVKLRDASNVTLTDVYLDLAHKQLESIASANLLVADGTIKPSKSGLLNLHDLQLLIPQIALEANNRTVHVQSLAPFNIDFGGSGSAVLNISNTTINLTQGALQIEQLEATESPNATSLQFTVNAQLKHAMTLTLGDGMQLIASQFHSRVCIGAESQIQSLQARLAIDKSRLLALLKPEIERKLVGVRLYGEFNYGPALNEKWMSVDIQPGVTAQLQWVHGTNDAIDVTINAKLEGEHKTFIASKGLFDWPMKWESDGHRVMGDANASLRCSLKINPGNNASIRVNTTVNSLQLPSISIFLIPVGDLLSQFGHLFKVPDTCVPLPNIGTATGLSFMRGLSIKSAQFVPSQTGNTVDLDINVSNDGA